MYANYLHNGATLLFPYIWNLKILPIKQNHVGYSYLFPMYDTETNSQRKKSFDKRFFFFWSIHSSTHNCDKQFGAALTCVLYRDKQISSDQYTHPHKTWIAISHFGAALMCTQLHVYLLFVFFNCLFNCPSRGFPQRKFWLPSLRLACCTNELIHFTWEKKSLCNDQC